MRVILLGPLAKPGRALKRELRAWLRSRPGTILLAVDGGAYSALASGVRPDCAIGDWDSFAERAGARGAAWKKLRAIPMITLPKGKDRSDLAHALRAAEALGGDELIALGLTGGRPDHHLSNLLEFRNASTGVRHKWRRLEAHGSDARYVFLSKSAPQFEESLKSGALVSIFCLNGVARGVTLKGLKYPLRNQAVESSSQGLSNQVGTAKAGARTAVSIRLKQGHLIVVIPKEATRG